MMRKTLTATILAISLFLFCSCKKPSVNAYIVFYKPYTDSSETNLYDKALVKFDYKTQYVNIKNSDVQKDVDNAIRHSDYRFIGISGNSYLYPGLEGGYVKNKDGEQEYIYLDSKYQKYVDKYKIKIIKGTSDMRRVGLPPLQRVAYDYAKKYNTLLFKSLKKFEKTNLK